MLEFSVFHSFLLYFLQMFQYILVFLPQEDEEPPENGTVLNPKRKHFFPFEFQCDLEIS